MVSLFQESCAYSKKLRPIGGILCFYESEGVKSAILRAQKQITGEGAILVDRMGEDELNLTVFHREKAVAKRVGEVLCSEIRTALAEERLSINRDDDR